VRQSFSLVLLLLITLTLQSQNAVSNLTSRKTAVAVRVLNAPRINGILDDTAWIKAPVTGDFKQSLPLFGHEPSFPTEVRILYDDYAIYVGALMHDPHPDSILMQLGNRDDDNLNADMFEVEFDTYNNQLDAYSFTVTSSGVQLDARKSDETYNGVWLSAVRKTEKGWVAELMIPYSAIRFPRTETQCWGFQIIRTVRRYRETDQFSPEKPGAGNNLVYWGNLTGISDVKPPVRLSLTPYVSVGFEHFPQTEKKDISTSFGGGTDLKYGINESYTVDMTLLPDFSQVQSDNKVKNLTAFETVYTEQRPFFREAVDLYNKGDIFYSRRIGKTPMYFYEAEDMAGEGYKLKKNPVQQRLLNATKISGRGKKGFALGILNAVTGNTYAIAEDTISGKEKKILTDPATNYSIVVFDQALKNNSDIYLINTNVIRGKGFGDANVTAAGIQLNNKKNIYQFNLNGGISQLYNQPDSSGSKSNLTLGYKYFAGLSKVNGRFQWLILHGIMDKNFNANDLGVTLYNNYSINEADVSYNLYQPWWIFRDWHNELSLENTNNHTTGLMQETELELESVATLLNYLTVWANMNYTFPNGHDYYETRADNRYYIQPEALSGTLGISSDYRKPFALDAGVTLRSASRDKTHGYKVNAGPIVRVNNHFMLKYEFELESVFNEHGYADTRDDGDIIFGNRDVRTVANVLNCKYLFINNLSLNLSARHYWSTGKYDQYYSLLQNGNLEENAGYTKDNNFSYNAFNVDMVFSWLFLPGSSMNIVWKNSILTEKSKAAENFFSNFSDTFDSPQQNNVSFKILYYLDYQQLKRSR